MPQKEKVTALWVIYEIIDTRRTQFYLYIYTFFLYDDLPFSISRNEIQ